MERRYASRSVWVLISTAELTTCKPPLQPDVGLTAGMHLDAEITIL